SLHSLRQGKSLVSELLAGVGDKYISSFRDTPLEPPAVYGRSEAVRYQRQVFVYRAALAEAGFPVPSSSDCWAIKGLFNSDLRNTLAGASGENADEYHRAANLMSQDRVTA